MSPEPNDFKDSYLEQVKEKTTEEPIIESKLRQETASVAKIISQAVTDVRKRMEEAGLSSPQIDSIYLLIDGDIVHPVISGTVLKEGEGALVLGGNNFGKEARGLWTPERNNLLVHFNGVKRLYEIFPKLYITFEGNLSLLSKEDHPGMPGMIEIKHPKIETDILEHTLEESLSHFIAYHASQNKRSMVQIMQRIHAGLNKAGGLE